MQELKSVEEDGISSPKGIISGMEISYVTNNNAQKNFVKGIDLKQKEPELQGWIHLLVSLCYQLYGNLRYLVSSSNLVAASRLVFSRTARDEEVITSPMTLPLVLLSSLYISRNVCRPVIMSKKIYGEEMTTNSFIKVVKSY